MRQFLIAALVIALSALVVYLRWGCFFIVGKIPAEWFIFSSYILLPLVEVIRTAPWVIAGYFLRGKGLYVVISVSIVAHPVIRNLILLELPFDAAKYFSEGLATAVISAVSFLAGAWIRNNNKYPNKALLPSGRARR